VHRAKQSKRSRRHYSDGDVESEESGNAEDVEMADAADTEAEEFSMADEGDDVSFAGT
jgi:hypothetical protein